MTSLKRDLAREEDVSRGLSSKTMHIQKLIRGNISREILLEMESFSRDIVRVDHYIILLDVDISRFNCFDRCKSRSAYLHQYLCRDQSLHDESTFVLICKRLRYCTIFSCMLRTESIIARTLNSNWIFAARSRIKSVVRIKVELILLRVTTKSILD